MPSSGDGKAAAPGKIDILSFMNKRSGDEDAAAPPAKRQKISPSKAAKGSAKSSPSPTASGDGEATSATASASNSRRNSLATSKSAASTPGLKDREADNSKLAGLHFDSAAWQANKDSYKADGAVPEISQVWVQATENLAKKKADAQFGEIVWNDLLFSDTTLNPENQRRAVAEGITVQVTAGLTVKEGSGGDGGGVGGRSESKPLACSKLPTASIF